MRQHGLSLDLTDYAPAFDGPSITTAIEDRPAPASLYERLIGPAFHTLPPTVRAMHRPWRDAAAEGEAEVTGGDNFAARAVAAIMRFPAPGHHALRVDFAVRGGVERWIRTSGDRSFSSELSASRGRLVERFGPFQFQFELPADSTGLSMRMHGWSAFAVRLPLVLGPRVTAQEWEADGQFQFDVSITLPLIGRIVHYRGWLTNADKHSGSTLSL